MEARKKENTPRKEGNREEGGGVKVKIKRLERKATARKEELKEKGKGRKVSEAGTAKRGRAQQQQQQEEQQQESRQSTMKEFFLVHHRVQGGRKE